MNTFRIDDRPIGDGHPAYVIGEIGINHNGEIAIAKALIDVAADAGCDAVKFQKRTPEICVPPDQQSVIRQTPWGEMTYLEYKRRVEFGEEEYSEIAAHARGRGIHWFASPWDVPSVQFLEEFDVVAHKVASASLTDGELLAALVATGKPLIVSTGMSTLDEVDRAMELLSDADVLLMHSTSTYPCPPEEVNLRTIRESARSLRRPGRLLRSREGPPGLARRSCARSRRSRAAHHPRSHDVGLGSGGEHRTAGRSRVAARHSDRRDVARRRRQATAARRDRAAPTPAADGVVDHVENSTGARHSRVSVPVALLRRGPCTGGGPRRLRGRAARGRRIFVSTGRDGAEPCRPGVVDRGADPAGNRTLHGPRR